MSRKEELAERMQARNREIGLLLSEARRAKNLTLEACGEATGMSRQYLALVERGQSSISAFHLGELCQLLEIPAAVFFPVEVFSSARESAATPVRDIAVQVQPGEAVRIFINMLDGAHGESTAGVSENVPNETTTEE
ncbi:MAG TPA: helix-turn-helix transcriptional regulator [Chloroflexia bacterium]|jgi:transcriptional regulator with XRE-family HTH domain